MFAPQFWNHQCSSYPVWIKSLLIISYSIAPLSSTPLLHRLSPSVTVCSEGIHCSKACSVVTVCLADHIINPSIGVLNTHPQSHQFHFTQWRSDTICKPSHSSKNPFKTQQWWAFSLCKGILTINSLIFCFPSWTQQSLREQLVWLATSQLSLNESIVSLYCGDISPTMQVGSISFMLTCQIDVPLETYKTGDQ